MYFPLFQGIVINVHIAVSLLVHKPCSQRYHQLKHSWSICLLYSHQNIFNSVRPPVNGFSHLYFPKAIKPAFSRLPFIPLDPHDPKTIPVWPLLYSHFFPNSLSIIGWAPLTSDPPVLQGWTASQNCHIHSRIGLLFIVFNAAEQCRKGSSSILYKPFSW